MCGCKCHRETFRFYRNGIKHVRWQHPAVGVGRGLLCTSSLVVLCCVDRESSKESQELGGCGLLRQWWGHVPRQDGRHRAQTTETNPACEAVGSQDRNLRVAGQCNKMLQLSHNSLSEICRVSKQSPFDFCVSTSLELPLSIHLFVRPYVPYKTFKHYFENRWTNFDANWHKWSTVQRHEAVKFGCQEVTGQGHRSRLQGASDRCWDVTLKPVESSSLSSLE